MRFHRIVLRTYLFCLVASGLTEQGQAVAAAPPVRALYVSTGGDEGDGSASRPFRTIQAAVDAATPATVILIAPGTYRENVKVAWNRGGSKDAMIWLAARDGPGSVQIVALDPQKPVIAALGVNNYGVRGLKLTGGYDGIQFSQSGRDFTKLVSNIAIEGNIIQNVQHDGIKVGQADNVRILGNVVSGTKNEEGIDFVAVTNATIQGNEVSNIGSPAAGIFAKGGSTNIKFADNYVHDVTGDGISAGGNTDATSFKPGFRGFEGKNMVVSGNRIEHVGKQPVSVRGAIGVVVSGNYLEANPARGVAVYVTRGNPRTQPAARSSHVQVNGNILKNVRSVLRIDPGNDMDVVESRNGGNDWKHMTGPAAVRKGLSVLPAVPREGDPRLPR